MVNAEATAAAGLLAVSIPASCLYQVPAPKGNRSQSFKMQTRRRTRNAGNPSRSAQKGIHENDKG
jgi:hypothetical protein